ncbi:MAG: hypothetical protein M0018_08640 [Nitrospiraceae bacterium]|nr:hypothetical protein [Nitrospiraceae bacterium]
MQPIYIFLLIILLFVPYDIAKYRKTKKVQFLFFLLAGIFMLLSIPIASYINETLSTIMMHISYSILIIGVFINLLPRASTHSPKKSRKFFNDQFNGISQIIAGILAIVYGIFSFKGDKIFPLSFIFLGLGAIIGAIFLLKRKGKEDDSKAPG